MVTAGNSAGCSSRLQVASLEETLRFSRPELLRRGKLPAIAGAAPGWAFGATLGGTYQSLGAPTGNTLAGVTVPANDVVVMGAFYENDGTSGSRAGWAFTDSAANAYVQYVDGSTGVSPSILNGFGISRLATGLAGGTVSWSEPVGSTGAGFIAARFTGGPAGPFYTYAGVTTRFNTLTASVTTPAPVTRGDLVLIACQTTFDSSGGFSSPFSSLTGSPAGTAVRGTFGHEGYCIWNYLVASTTGPVTAHVTRSRNPGPAELTIAAVAPVSRPGGLTFWM